MPVSKRVTIACPILLALLPACARNAASTDPSAAQYNDYYSEKPSDGSPPPATDQNPGTGKKAVPMSSTATRGAAAPKRIRAKRPAKQGTPTNPVPDPGETKDVTITGVLPTTTSVGSAVEVLGSKLDAAGLVVRIEGTDQKLLLQEPNRLVFEAKGKSGVISVGTKKGSKFTAIDRTDLKLDVLANDRGLGRPRTKVGNGLLGNIYAIDKPATELPAFDSLGAPIGTIAVDNLDIPASPFQKTIAGRTEQFGIHFRGSLNVLEGGSYNFCLEATSGALLFLDGTDIIDNDGAHAMAEKCSEFEVEAGEYQLDLLWYHGKAGDLGLRFTWAKDGGAKIPVPPEALFPPADVYSSARK